MLERSYSRMGVTGELLLVASVLTLVPSWVGGAELLSSVGMGNLPAVLVGGAVAWGRGALSAAILLRRWRRGSLILNERWFRDALETAAGRSRLAEYPTPAPGPVSLSAGGAGSV
ncbi:MULTISPECIES: hypothetical protein [Halolamina]|uniref:Uncharacterized protein n=1 Tax=Halolamina pelagica TaxID=699431 RepID=A0A1I5MRD7_9EURY|nr:MULTISPECIES: hypothetical protein [Halolamina]NHX36109.1 hypothetical protein [Halolamina sp. R1-12]SFP11501.1 hypothetical protein SAMN05216277_101354 [Halolamina pelagica]